MTEPTDQSTAQSLAPAEVSGVESEAMDRMIAAVEREDEEPERWDGQS